MEVDESIEQMTFFWNGKPEPIERMTLGFQQIPRAVQTDDISFSKGKSEPLEQMTFFFERIAGASRAETESLSK